MAIFNLACARGRQGNAEGAAAALGRLHRLGTAKAKKFLAKAHRDGDLATVRDDPAVREVIDDYGDPYE